MLEFLRALRQRNDVWVRLPGMVLAFLIAEVFYKFHSFALECGAFLLTWLAIDIAVEQIARRVGHSRANRLP